MSSVSFIILFAKDETFEENNYWGVALSLSRPLGFREILTALIYFQDHIS